MFNPEKFGAEMGDLVLRAIAPLQQRIAELEKQLAARPDVARLIADEVTRQVKAMPPARDGKDGKDGKDADMPMLMLNMSARIRAAIEDLPKPNDGKDGKDGAPGRDGNNGKDGADGKDGAPGKDGTSITLDDVRPAIDAAVRSAIGAIPQPKDGRDGADGKDGAPGKDGTSITLDDVRPAIDAAVRSAIGAIPLPKDGRDGVDGKDGANGQDGRDGQDGKSFTLDDATALLAHHWSVWELDFERRASTTLVKAVDRLPKPRDGKDGKDGKKGADGRDGLGFDDLSFEHDGARTVTLKFQRGDVIKTFDLTFPIVLDRGVYRDGMECAPGDGVTWAGSYWIAQRATKAKPDGPDSGFRLAVKRGRDGRDGRDGIDKEPVVKLKD